MRVTEAGRQPVVEGVSCCAAAALNRAFGQRAADFREEKEGRVPVESSRLIK
jgi:hypothetical protein